MLIQIALLSVIYFITGKLGLLLAVPPGFASLVWPPIGLSIAGLLYFGINRWPGVLLGAFLVNAKTLSLQALIMALGISMGNTLPVILAAFLIKKTLKFPKASYSAIEIIQFLVLAGPVAAVISSSVGVGCLYFFDLLHPRNLTTNWLSWFIGDASGGIIFAPLALIFSLQSWKQWQKPLFKVVLPLLLFFTMIIVSLEYVQKVEREKAVNDFQNKSQMVTRSLQESLDIYSTQIEILRRFFENSEEVTNNEFQSFTEVLLAKRTDIVAYAWIPHSEKSSAKYQTKYTVGSTPLLNPDFSGLEQNQEIRNLIDECVKEKKTVVSNRLDLEPFGLKEPGIFVAAWTAQPAGVILQMIRLNAMLAYVGPLASSTTYRIQIESLNSPNSPLSLVETFSQDSSQLTNAAPLTWSTPLALANQSWRLTFSQDFFSTESSTLKNSLFLLTPLVFTFLACALLLVIFIRAASIEESVQEKTRDLQDLNLRLEKASQTKSEFLANMSHEIRTPLNVLLGMSDLLDSADLSEEQHRYIDISRKAGDNLLHIINDILDISKIEAGVLTLEKTEIYLPNLVQDVADMFALKCREKRLTLQVQLAPEVQKSFLGDPIRIRQILSNLVSNAIKFTMQGGITIQVKTNQDPSRPGNILFEVIDTGIGIPPEKRNQLFRPFTQADSTITRKYGGTGLGLSISKRLTEMMNGTMTFSSDINKGSTFSFTLDLPGATGAATVSRTAQENTSHSQTGISSAKKLRILIVDDTEDNRTLIKAFLKDTPHELLDAENGERALEMTKRNTPDLILMDMQMPVMDGFTATRNIRAWELENKMPPVQIWALTAYAMSTEVTKSLEAGCNLHLVKPIRRQELLRRVHEFTEVPTEK